MSDTAQNQTSSNAATFEFKVNGIRTTTVNGLSNVVRQVDFTIKATQDGQSFELPQSTDLGDPLADSFKPIEQLVEADVVSWIESNFVRMDAVKFHMQHMLNEQISRAALEPAHLPWAPVIEEPVIEEPAVEEPAVDNAVVEEQAAPAPTEE